jgi:3-dehydroquinate synthetase
VAELVERAMWAKVEVVLADEREQGAAGGRIALNLGHSAGHAFEAAAGYDDLLHGEAVAYGLRVAVRLGVALGVTPAARAERTEQLLDALALGTGRLPYTLAQVLDLLGADKKHAAGQLRWVLPTADGIVVRADVPDEMVSTAIRSVLAESASAPSGARASGAAGR